MLFSLLFPFECEVCGNLFQITTQNYVCEDCLKSIYKTEFVYCHSCGKITSNCQNCMVEKKFEDIGVFTRVDDKLTRIIGIYKLKSIKALAKPLSELIYDDITEFVVKNKIDIITYIPLYKSLEKKRGFNHLKEILLNIFPEVAVKEVLKKVRNTKLQMDLTKEEREKNLKGAFVLKNFSKVEGKNILIFDDIMTTGSTLLECYKEIKKGKPKGIFGYVIGR